jgi:hypothetical protein
MKLRLAGTMNRWNVEHQFLFRLDWPLFSTAAGLTPEDLIFVSDFELSKHLSVFAPLRLADYDQRNFNVKR